MRYFRPNYTFLIVRAEVSGSGDYNYSISTTFVFRGEDNIFSVEMQKSFAKSLGLVNFAAENLNIL